MGVSGQLHTSATSGRLHTSDFSCCDYRAGQMKHMVLYGSARTGDYLIMAIKKLQCVPFPGQHDCRWTAACTNETHRNKWVCMHSRLLPPFLCETSTVQVHFLVGGWYEHKEFLLLWRSERCMIAKYWFWKLKNVLLSITVLWKNTVIRVSKTDWGEVCEAVVWVEPTGQPRETRKR